MRQRERDSLIESDAHDLLFGDDDPVDSGDPGYDGEDDRQTRSQRRRTRAEYERRHRRRTSGRMITALAVVLVVVVAAAAWFIGRPLYGYFHPDDYSGSGYGSALVAVHSGDDAKTIGTTLHDRDVVASVRAFTDAAADNDKSVSIQPGSYLLHEHMSAKAALGMLLDPSSRQSTTITIPEGSTARAVLARLSAPRCAKDAQRSAKCGLGLKHSAVVAAAKDVSTLPLPKGYGPGSRKPTSVEGFLFPATYPLDPTASAADALQHMITKFIAVDRSTGFAQHAGELRLTPYQALIIASIAQAEAKYPADMGKVVRVILNRLATNVPLKIDAVSRYGAVQQGRNPDKVDYAKIKSPYNTYTHQGLPPTPISNPGVAAMKATIHPAAGPWLYYVNGTKDGHLFFTKSEHAFVVAQQKCHDHNWGCAAP